MEINLELTTYKKVLLFGSQGTGKSTLSQRFLTEKFEQNLKHTEDSK